MKYLYEFKLSPCGWGKNKEEAWESCKNNYDIDQEKLPLSSIIDIDDDASDGLYGSFLKTNKIRDWLKLEISNKLDIPITDISDQSKFVDDLGCDSLDFVEIVMEAEKEFSIIVLESDILEDSTVRDLLMKIIKEIE